MRRPCTPAIVDETEELNEVTEWKTKKWIVQVLTSFLKRYGSPKKVPVDEPWAHNIVENFKSRHAEPATTVMLHIISSDPNRQQLSLRVSHYDLDIIEESIETTKLLAIIIQHVDNLLTGVVFSYLCFSEENENLRDNEAFSVLYVVPPFSVFSLDSVDISTHVLLRINQTFTLDSSFRWND